ncbi:hypothetical protein [uncultured Desulfobacter sp.]|uniref:hypothetical protein n=1 Tax=uncultured Desulfobacter sp. TaxID=240139 RepID=UPI002AAADEDA|nr:hypothetical protein [uncultured Desulfobacter sp.]
MAKKRTTWPGRQEPKSDIQVLADTHHVPAWELAGVMRASRWAAGKHVTEDEFISALEMFRQRRQGAGRI